MGEPFTINRDIRGRLEAEIIPGITAILKLLPEDHRKRIIDGCHAFVTLDIDTPIGVFRGREVNIIWSDRRSKFLVHYPQFMSGKRGTDTENWMDYFGPLKAQTRYKAAELILDLHEQILEESRAGRLAVSSSYRAHPRAEGRPQEFSDEEASATTSTLKDVPGGDELASLQTKLEEAEKEPSIREVEEEPSIEEASPEDTTEPESLVDQPKHIEPIEIDAPPLASEPELYERACVSEADLPGLLEQLNRSIQT